MIEPEEVGGDASAARRRTVLLGGALALPVLLVLAGFTSAWPLLALPLCLAFPLGGQRGMATAVCVAGVTVALVSGRPGTDGAALAVGIAAFAVTGLAVGAGYRARTLDVERMASLSFTDRLTGLHNYAFFADALPRECRRAERYVLPLSLVLMDLDRFKDFNDRYGHDAGNRMLAAVGEAIRLQHPRHRHAGALRGRGVRAHRARAVRRGRRGRRARSRRRGPPARRGAGGAAVGITISAGVADFRNGADDLDGDLMLRRADTALYRSKAEGRDGVSLHAPDDSWAAVS